MKSTGTDPDGVGAALRLGLLAPWPAAATRDAIVEQAKTQAQDEASRILEHARTQIAAEKESAMRDIRKEVALLSVEVAEKVIRKELEPSGVRDEYVDRLVDEIRS